jgi:hypothetical protein
VLGGYDRNVSQVRDRHVLLNSLPLPATRSR